MLEKGSGEHYNYVTVGAPVYGLTRQPPVNTSNMTPSAKRSQIYGILLTCRFQKKKPMIFGEIT